MTFPTFLNALVVLFMLCANGDDFGVLSHGRADTIRTMRATMLHCRRNCGAPQYGAGNHRAGVESPLVSTGIAPD